MGNQLIVLVVGAGIASAIVFGLVKLGEIIVKRRTAALLAEYDGSADDEIDPQN